MYEERGRFDGKQRGSNICYFFLFFFALTAHFVQFHHIPDPVERLGRERKSAIAAK
jgi:hypothetical protein